MIKNEILEYLKQLKPHLSKQGITSLGLFGSFTTNSETEISDIDIVYKTSNLFTNKYKGWEAFTYLNENIRDKISKNFNRKVDLFDLNSNSYIKDNIYKNSIYV
jgi:predicted nucleotidyltransferase